MGFPPSRGCFRPVFRCWLPNVTSLDPLGLIVGYVGASHIPDYKKDTHAEMLMSGAKAKNGKGAEIVISDMKDLLKVIEFFAGEKTAGKSPPFDFPEVRQSVLS